MSILLCQRWTNIIPFYSTEKNKRRNDQTRLQIISSVLMQTLGKCNSSTLTLVPSSFSPSFSLILSLNNKQVSKILMKTFVFLQKWMSIKPVVIEYFLFIYISMTKCVYTQNFNISWQSTSLSFYIRWLLDDCVIPMLYKSSEQDWKRYTTHKIMRQILIKCSAW